MRKLLAKVVTLRILFSILIIFSTFLHADYNIASSYVNASTVSNDEFENEFGKDQKDNLFDPLSGYNEVMTSVNDIFYENILRPTALGYAYVVPQPARNGISNFFENLFFPIRFVNNLLQFKFQNSAEELQRFVINSTLGIVGFADIASEQFNIKAHKEDFGQTLGHYGLGNGFHVVLPLLGPSNLRDIVGIVGDSWANPISYIESRQANLLDNDKESLYVKVFHIVNKTSLHVDEYDSFKKDAIELYPFLRNAYESRRNKLISE